jgi:hypothetical protein
MTHPINEVDEDIRKEYEGTRWADAMIAQIMRDLKKLIVLLEKRTEATK